MVDLEVTPKEIPLRGTKGTDSKMAAHRAMWRLQRHASEGLLFLKRRRRIRLRRFRVRFRCAPEVLEFLPHEDEWSDVEEEDEGKPKGWSRLKGRRGSGVRYKASSWDDGDDLMLDQEEMQPPLMLCVICLLAIALAAAYQWIPRPGFMPFT